MVVWRHGAKTTNLQYKRNSLAAQLLAKMQPFPRTCDKLARADAKAGSNAGDGIGSATAAAAMTEFTYLHTIHPTLETYFE
jgi:hypothetical protein